MAAIAVSLFYVFLFVLLIYKTNFFIIPGIPKLAVIAVFLIKIIFGTLLWAFYTFNPQGTSDADIYKYFNDSKIIFGALHHHPLDYIKLITGIGNDTAYFEHTYYAKMSFWYRSNGNNVFNDDRTIIRFNALIRIFSLGYYHVHTVFMSFLSLTGLVYLYKFFADKVQDKKWLLFIIVFLVPTVLFWGSGVLKEGLLLFALGIFINNAFALLNGSKTLTTICLLMLSVVLLLMVKVYILLCMLPLLMAYTLSRKSATRYTLYNYLGVITGVVALASIVHIVIPRYSVLTVFSKKQNDFFNLAKGGVYLGNDSITIWITPAIKNPVIGTTDSTRYKIKPGINYYYWKNAHKQDTLFVNKATDSSTYPLLFRFKPAGSVINIARLKPNVASFFKNSGSAIYYAFYSPIWSQANTLSKKISWLENIAISLFIIVSVVCSLKFKRINLNLFLFCLLFSLSIYLMVGLTTPVAGAIVRYKMPAIPFLLFAFLLLFDGDKLKAKLITFQKKRS